MKDRFLTLVSPIILLVVWELLVATGVLDARFFPAPSEIFQRLFELLEDGALVTATAITLRRLTVGFVLAVVPAILVGVLMGVNRTTRLILSPLISSILPRSIRSAM